VEGVLILLWFALPVGAISTGTSKVYHYIYPFLPPLYLCAGYVMAYAAEWLERVLRAPTARFGGFGVFARAGLVAAVVLAALPLRSYEATIERTERYERDLTRLVECALPISERLVAAGRRGPAVWSDANVSHVPVYYLQPLGLWQRAGKSSTAVTLEWILYRPARVIVLGPPQWESLQHDLATNRADLIARLAALAGADPQIESKLRDAVIGVSRHDRGNVFVLPEPLSACATELIPLVSR
jgi:hypothetical protein